MRSPFDKLYRRDQHHTKRWEKYYTDKQYFALNRELRKELEALLKKRKSLTGREYYITGIIYHHAHTVSSTKRAIAYAKKSAALDYMPGKTLTAQATDRLLQLQGKPQKFGTQCNFVKGKWKMHPVDGTISDEERKEHGLPALRELKKYLTE